VCSFSEIGGTEWARGIGHACHAGGNGCRRLARIWRGSFACVWYIAPASHFSANILWAVAEPDGSEHNGLDIALSAHIPRSAITLRAAAESVSI